MNYKDCNFLSRDEYNKNYEYCQLKVNGRDMCNRDKCIFIRDRVININGKNAGITIREAVTEEEIKDIGERILNELNKRNYNKIRREKA